MLAKLALLAAAVPDLRDGDLLVVASKVVAKAEGRTVEARNDSCAGASEESELRSARGDTRGDTRGETAAKEDVSAKT